MPAHKATAPADAPPTPSYRGRRLAWILWPILMLYFGGVVVRAHGELNADTAVNGLFRTWHPPRTLAIGQVFDVRTGDLSAEIDARFETVGPRPRTDDINAWRAALTARGLQPIASTGPGEGEPRLVFTPTGPWLIVRRAHGSFVTFDPRRGMILLHEGVIAPDAPALRFAP